MGAPVVPGSRAGCVVGVATGPEYAGLPWTVPGDWVIGIACTWGVARGWVTGSRVNCSTFSLGATACCGTPSGSGETDTEVPETPGTITGGVGGAVVIGGGREGAVTGGRV